MLAKASCGSLLRIHTQVHNTVLCELLVTACYYYPTDIRMIALLGFRRTVKKPLLQILQRHKLLKIMSVEVRAMSTETQSHCAHYSLYEVCLCQNV